jgi:hypothetical protein
MVTFRICPIARLALYGSFGRWAKEMALGLQFHLDPDEKHTFQRGGRLINCTFYGVLFLIAQTVKTHYNLFDAFRLGVDRWRPSSSRVPSSFLAIIPLTHGGYSAKNVVSCRIFKSK